MSTVAPETPAPVSRVRADWLAVLVTRHSEGTGESTGWLVPAGAAGGPRLLVEGGSPSAAEVAHDSDALVLFDGVLHSRGDVAALAGLPHSDESPSALLLLKAWHTAGLDRLLAAVRGVFALLVWDRASGTLWAARDQIGIHPLYYAHSRQGIAVAASADVLLAQPGVTRALSGVALAEYLAQRHASTSETFYEAVHRCPPATVLRIDAAGVAEKTYWDPLPDAEAVRWLAPGEEEAFEGVFERAVTRSMLGDRAGIFLSGGLDSIAVAAVATAAATRNGSQGPLALSLGFDEPDCDEREVQRNVADRLGLRQVAVSFGEAVPPDAFIRHALSMGADWTFPMWNIWSPAYAALVSRARECGCGTVLTGRGGDEWLTVSPYHAADLARSGNFGGLLRLLRSRNRSRRHTGVRYSWELLKNRVARPIGSALLDAVAPAAWHAQRRRRLEDALPAWLAPAAHMRRAMRDRVDRFIGEARPRRGFYVREMKATLSHPSVTGDLEETQEFGRRLGIRMHHPFWDADLVEFLCRMPPHLLDAGGRAKAPLRAMVSRRVPGLGLERQKKAHALRFFDSMMRAEAPGIFRDLGGLRTLGALGVLEPAATEAHLATLLQGRYVKDPGRVVEVLTLETWARGRVH